MNRCVDCHFFIYSSYDPNTGDKLYHLVHPNLRLLTENLDFSWRTNLTGSHRHFLSCHFGVWDEEISTSGDLPQDNCVKDRKDSCFFRAYRPGMQLSTAQQLWEQDKRSISERKDRRLTRISLSIAGVALLLNLAFQVYLYWPDIKSRWTKIETITEIQESDSLN